MKKLLTLGLVLFAFSAATMAQSRDNRFRERPYSSYNRHERFETRKDGNRYEMGKRRAERDGMISRRERKRLKEMRKRERREAMRRRHHRGYRII
jgi:hypothetical protein